MTKSDRSYAQQTLERWASDPHEDTRAVALYLHERLCAVERALAALGWAGEPKERCGELQENGNPSTISPTNPKTTTEE